MILLIGKDNKVEEIIDESKFSELGIWERKHMEEWVAKYPNILGEELITITTEYSKFDKTSNRLDVLAVDKNGKIVVIELKRDVADKFVDLQAIHYASYCSNLNLEQVVKLMSEYKNKSKDEMETKLKNFILNEDFSDFDNQPRIMLVANDFREETLAAVLWLRDNGIDITCIKLEPYKIGTKIAVKPEIIIPLPEAKDFMIQAEQKKKSSSTKTQYQKDLYQFWKRILVEFKDKKPGLIDFDYVSTPWLLFNTGFKNVHFEWYFKRRNQKGFFVALHFENKYEENKKICEYFRAKKEKIQNLLHIEEIHFVKAGNHTQIYLMRESIEFDDKNLDWGVKTMIKLYDVLNPIVKEYFTMKNTVL